MFFGVEQSNQLIDSDAVIDAPRLEADEEREKQHFVAACNESEDNQGAAISGPRSEDEETDRLIEESVTEPKGDADETSTSLRPDEPFSPEESPKTSNFEIRQPDSESDPIIQSMQNDIEEESSEFHENTMESLVKMKINPSTKDFVIRGNLSDAPDRAVSTSTAISRVSRQDSISRQAPLGTIGGRNFQFNFSGCNFGSASFGGDGSSIA